MNVQDVKRTAQRAIIKAAMVTKQLPRLLSDTSSCYIADKRKTCLRDNNGMPEVSGRPIYIT
jgi:hypothetical protein